MGWFLLGIKYLVLRDRRRSRFAGVRGQLLCRHMFFRGSIGVMEHWSIVEDSVSDGGTRDSQNCSAGGQKNNNFLDHNTFQRFLFFAFQYSNTPILQKNLATNYPPLIFRSKADLASITREKRAGTRTMVKMVETISPPVMTLPSPR